jgi:SAM-dependent methyltransferase
MSAQDSRRTGKAYVKTYDRAYFDRWYRAPGAAARADALRRRVRLALAAAEYLLQREVRSVLDVGCGEAPWRAELRRIRPQLRYVGVDDSEYVVRRHGRRRGIVHGSVGTIARLGLRRRFDLVVCADVLHYVPLAEMRRGLRSMRRLLGGVAYLDVFTVEDSFRGDVDGWQPRPAALYRREFRHAGLVPCGLNCYLPEEQAALASALELA